MEVNTKSKEALCSEARMLPVMFCDPAIGSEFDCADERVSIRGRRVGTNPSRTSEHTALIRITTEGVRHHGVHPSAFWKKRTSMSGDAPPRMTDFLEHLRQDPSLQLPFGNFCQELNRELPWEEEQIELHILAQSTKVEPTTPPITRPAGQLAWRILRIVGAVFRGKSVETSGFATASQRTVGQRRRAKVPQ